MLIATATPRFREKRAPYFLQTNNQAVDASVGWKSGVVLEKGLKYVYYNVIVYIPRLADQIS